MNERASIGRTGEEIAKRFLLKKGYEIIETNYSKFHGEIDIIAKDRNEIVFVEVKTIKCENIDSVAHETYRPEFNFNENKLKIISRTADLYFAEKRLKNDWRVDLVAVELQLEPKKAKVRHLKAVNFS